MNCHKNGCSSKCWLPECSYYQTRLKKGESVFNQFTAVGNLTRDIELRYSQSGTAIANTGLATSRKFTQNGERKEEVCFIDITFFGRSAEVANQYLRKGSKILVSGRIKFDQWTAQDGSKRSKHSVIVETMQMLDKKDDSGSQPQGYNHSGQGMNQPTQHEHPQHTDYQPQQQMPPQQQQIDIDNRFKDSQ